MVIVVLIKMAINWYSHFVQKPYLRTIFIESNIDEDLDLENLHKIKNLPDPTNIQDACSKNYVDRKFNDPSIIKTHHIYFWMIEKLPMRDLCKLINGLKLILI